MAFVASHAPASATISAGGGELSCRWQGGLEGYNRWHALAQPPIWRGTGIHSITFKIAAKLFAAQGALPPMTTITRKQSPDPPNLKCCEGDAEHQQADGWSVEVKSHHRSTKSSKMNFDAKPP